MIDDSALVWRMSGLMRDRTAEPSSETKFSGANENNRKKHFPVELTTSRIGKQLVPNLLDVMTVHNMRANMSQYSKHGHLYCAVKLLSIPVATHHAIDVVCDSSGAARSLGRRVWVFDRSSAEKAGGGLRCAMLFDQEKAWTSVEKASTAMDLGTIIFLISACRAALRNLCLLIKTYWSVICLLCS